LGWREAACRRNPSSASPPAWPSLPCFDYAASASPFLCSSPLRSLARRPPELELARAPASVAKHGADPLGAQARPAQGHGAGRQPSSARLAMDARAGRRSSSPWRRGRPRGAPPPSSLVLPLLHPPARPAPLFLRSTAVELAPLLPRSPSAPSTREARAPPAAPRRRRRGGGEGTPGRRAGWSTPARGPCFAPRRGEALPRLWPGRRGRRRE